MVQPGGPPPKLMPSTHNPLKPLIKQEMCCPYTEKIFHQGTQRQFPLRPRSPSITALEDGLVWTWHFGSLKKAYSCPKTQCGDSWGFKHHLCNPQICPSANHQLSMRKWNACCDVHPSSAHVPARCAGGTQRALQEELAKLINSNLGTRILKNDSYHK